MHIFSFNYTLSSFFKVMRRRHSLKFIELSSSLAGWYCWQISSFLFSSTYYLSSLAGAGNFIFLYINMLTKNLNYDCFELEAVASGSQVVKFALQQMESYF